MPMLRRPPGGTRAALVVVLLLLTLAMTGAMAYEAQRAARSHRAAAEGVLRDYAALAAFLYRQNGRAALGRAISYQLYPFEQVRATADGPLPTVREANVAPTEECPICPKLDSIRYFWRLDLRDGSLQTTAGDGDPALRAWLADTVAGLAARRPQTERGFETALLFGAVGGRERGIAYVVRRDAAGRPRAAYGFEANPAVLAKAGFESVHAGASVLPPTLTRGLPANSLVSLAVTAPGGGRLWASPASRRAAAAATDTIGEVVGGLTVHAALREEAAGRLVIGGVPGSRLPHLLVIELLAVGLTVAAIHQLRRERELSRLRADFVSSVSHELRTPLAQIRMFAETLRLGRVRSDAERVRSIEIIDQEARRLGALVDNVLTFSRAERRQVRLSPAPAELAPLVREALESFAPLAAARRVTVREALEGGVWASVDRGAFRQVLLNLLDNAAKYGPPGQTVEVGSSRSGDRVRVWVRDGGPGIPPRERERIFAPFVRLERDAGSAVAGSGIGLAVVAQLAEAHGGRARAEDAPGGGARFVVELPALAETPADSGDAHLPNAGDADRGDADRRTTGDADRGDADRRTTGDADRGDADRRALGKADRGDAERAVSGAAGEGR